MLHKFFCLFFAVILVSFLLVSAGCSKREKISHLAQLSGKVFAVPTGTAADKLTLSRFPDAKFQYYNSVLDTVLAVKNGKADAAAYDEPILKNIAAKNSGVMVLPEMITTDNYGFAVQHGRHDLKTAVDQVVDELKKTGGYKEMVKRWLPETGSPAAMPSIVSSGAKGVLKLGVAATNEPFAFVDSKQEIVGLDIEIARLVAKKLDMKLEIANMDFGGMIPALTSGKVDMIASCITITEERAKKVLFSEPYYIGGIAALVRK